MKTMFSILLFLFRILYKFVGKDKAIEIGKQLLSEAVTHLLIPAIQKLTPDSVDSKVNDILAGLMRLHGMPLECQHLVPDEVSQAQEGQVKVTDLGITGPIVQKAIDNVLDQHSDGSGD